MDGLVQPGIWLDCDAPFLALSGVTPSLLADLINGCVCMPSGQPLGQSVDARILDLISEG